MIVHQEQQTVVSSELPNIPVLVITDWSSLQFSLIVSVKMSPRCVIYQVHLAFTVTTSREYGEVPAKRAE